MTLCNVNIEHSSSDCPDGTSTFMDGDRLICYFAVTSNQNFDQSRVLCDDEQTGADLAIIPNPEAQQFIESQLNGANGLNG